MLPETEAWLRGRTSSSEDWPLPRLLEAKADTRVSVVLPARDEGQTVGEIVSAIRRELMDAAPLVDELVVIDSRSTDDTAARAAAAGARVVAQDEVLPDLKPLDGKGRRCGSPSPRPPVTCWSSSTPTCASSARRS
nr:hypothetical protein GCM10020093_006280 [Planobispora longispora]